MLVPLWWQKHIIEKLVILINDWHIVQDIEDDSFDQEPFIHSFIQEIVHKHLLCTKFHASN